MNRGGGLYPQTDPVGVSWPRTMSAGQSVARLSESCPAGKHDSESRATVLSPNILRDLHITVADLSLARCLKVEQRVFDGRLLFSIGPRQCKPLGDRFEVQSAK